MLTYDFSKRENLSKYEYLYQCLRKDIMSGKIAEGEKMPSKRQLAEANGISIRTVMNAYDQLMMEGYLTAKQRSGYYVDSNFSPAIRYQNIPIPDVAPEKKEEWLADFTVNTIVYDKFPFSAWTKVLKQVLADYHVHIMRRGDFLGSKELRAAISKYLYKNRGMRVSPDCIVIGTGIEYLYSKLIHLLPETAVYAVENPGYRKIRRVYNSVGVNWISLDMDKNGVRMSSLKKSGATVVHVSPEHQYPLGTVMSARRRQELLMWAEDSPDHYIIEDDYDCEFRYRGHPIPALYGMDNSNRVIYMNTFSKTLSPAIRISYMVLPEKLLEQYVNSANFFSNTSSNLEQHTLARFISQGYFERHLNRMRNYYHSRGKRLLCALDKSFGVPIESVSSAESGTHLLVRIETNLSDKEIKERAREKGINLNCLSEFCMGSYPEYEHTLVLNYSNMDHERTHEIMRILGEALR